ncbi:MAG: AAA family ATPase [Candidatus Omnitrophota bacterium]
MEDVMVSVGGSPVPAHKLEIGIHSFKDRILKNCVYVDKTQYIYDLINRESNCFLSRPRRFGKSLLISTLKEIFKGSKELFKNCWIYNKTTWEAYTIIHIDFIEIDFKTFGLEPAIDNQLEAMAAQFDIKLARKSIKEKFAELIQILAKDKQVVILIDEYDKPITEYIDNIPEAEKNRDILKNFYSVLKSQVSNIRFLLITGVSKFSRVSIFSDLNHLADITIDPRYSKMLGYTSEEIEHYFSDYIDAWEAQTHESRTILFEKFDISSLDISVLLFQTGYLTIKALKDKKYVLSYPNLEVRESFLQYLLEGYSGKSEDELSPVTEKEGHKTEIKIQPARDEIEHRVEREMARRMLEKKYPVEEIVALTGLSEEEIRSL